MGSSTRSNLFRKHGYSFITLIAILVFLIYPNIGMYDWNKEVQYCDFIKQSLLEYNVFPMFMWNSGILAIYPAVRQSAFFAGNPETMLFSPFLPMLQIMPPALFLKLLVLIHFLIGWAGIQALAKTCSWNVRQTRIFSAVFMLSPIIIQHISIGYLPWINLFFFPWLLNFLLDKNDFKKWLGCSIVLALMLLQGGLHVFVWSGFLIAFFSVFQTIFRKSGKSLLLSVASVITASLLALPRIVTSFQAFGAFEQRFFSGYSLGAFLKWGLIPPFFTPSTMDDIEFFIEEYIKGVPYWDGSLFWGFVLICVLALPFVIGYTYKKGDRYKFDQNELEVLALAASSALILLISFNGLYAAGISFISNLLRLPALKGMEKYPFRFTIPAYFGFAFVTAWYWESIQVILTRLMNQIRSLAAVFRKGFLRFAAVLRGQKKNIFWMAVFFVVACAVFIMLKNTIMDWIYSQITLAYSGQGAEFLVGLMENSGTIPLVNYFTKAETLIAYFQRTIFVVAIITVSLWVIGSRYNLNDIKEKKQLIRDLIFPFWLMEALVVLPLLLAFGMWWRVSLATPMKTIPDFEMRAPIVNFANEDIDLGMPDMQFTPHTLQIEVTEDMIGETLVFSKIPYNDTRFLTIEKGNGIFIEEMGKTALKIVGSGSILVQVRNTSFVFSVIVGVIGWVAVGGLIFRSERIRKKKE